MKTLTSFPGSPRAAVLGALIMLPAVLLCTFGILYSGLGIQAANDLVDAALATSAGVRVLVHPVILMGGPLLAISLNLFGVVGLRWGEEADGFTAALFIRRKPLNLAIAVAGAMIVCALLLYLVGENFIISPR